MKEWISEHWEKTLFRLLGLGLFGYSIRFLFQENITAFSAASVAGFFCFVYANFSRFKRFKGLGIEAELWEDKQQEAAELIEQLKDIVSIYTNEIVVTRIKQGRMGSGKSSKENWIDIWNTFRKLTQEHGKLGQKIDFGETQRVAEVYLIFDVMLQMRPRVAEAVGKGIQKARELVSKKYHTDDTGEWQARLNEIDLYKLSVSEPIDLAKEKKLAATYYEKLLSTRNFLKSRYDVEIDLDPELEADLKLLADLEARPKLDMTDDLLEQVTNLFEKY